MDMPPKMNTWGKNQIETIGTTLHPPYNTSTGLPLYDIDIIDINDINVNPITYKISKRHIDKKYYPDKKFICTDIQELFIDNMDKLPSEWQQCDQSNKNTTSLTNAINTTFASLNFKEKADGMRYLLNSPNNEYFKEWLNALKPSKPSKLDRKIRITFKKNGQQLCYNFDDGITKASYDYNSIHKIFNSPTITRWKTFRENFLQKNVNIKEAFYVFRNKQIFSRNKPEDREMLLKLLLENDHEMVYLDNLRAEISNIIKETKSSAKCIAISSGGRKKKTKKPSKKKPSKKKLSKTKSKKSPKIHTGPRGGKYIIKKGKKIYQ